MKKLIISLVNLCLICFAVSGEAQAGKVNNAIKLYTSVTAHTDDVSVAAAKMVDTAIVKTEELLIATDKWMTSLVGGASPVNRLPRPAAHELAITHSLTGPVICPEDYKPNIAEAHWINTPSENPC